MNSDVIIVGSGPAGVSAAWPLVEAGLSVTMIEAAGNPAPPGPHMDIETFRRGGDGWRHAFGDDLAGLKQPLDRSPKFSTRIAQAVLSANAAPPAIHASGFMPVRSSAAGGLTSLWGAFVTAFDAWDLRDFPIRQSDLVDSYRSVAARIGISGQADDLSAFHGPDMALQPAAWLSPIVQELRARYEARRPLKGVRFGAARNAIITEPADGREACNRCGLCLYGCARGAVYESGSELIRLRKMRNFTYIGNARVVKTSSSGDAGQIVEFVSDQTRFTRTARAVILAAGTLNTTALVLSRSGAVGTGLRLLTNPVAAMAFILPSHLGKPPAVSGFSLGQLSFRLELEAPSDYATGVLFTADALPYSLLAERMPFSRPAALRLAGYIAGSVLLATVYLPGRYSRNTLTLKRDPAANEELHITGEIIDETRRLLHRSAQQLARAMRKLGAFALPGSTTVTIAGTDVHLAGTLPMKADGAALTCTPDCEVRPWHDIYVVDGSCLSDLPAKHCTFTIMANADRVGRVVARKLASAAQDSKSP